MSLNGIRFGAPQGELEFFGRPSNPRPFKEEYFLFGELGFAVGTLDGRIVYFGLPIVRRDIDEVGPCETAVVFPDGSRMTLKPGVAVGAALSHLPEPDSVDSDDDESVYEFSFEGIKLEVECSLDGEVMRLNLFTE